MKAEDQFQVKFFGKWQCLHTVCAHNVTETVKGDTEINYLAHHGVLSPDDLATVLLLTTSMNPTQCFLYDHAVCQDIAEWKSDGDQVVLMGDFNEDMHSEPLKSMFAKLSMREIITSTNDPTKAPGTYNRGSIPIDGIWATFHLEPIRAGYTDMLHGFGGDHHISWTDFTFENAFAHLLPTIERPIARRLQLGDPRVVAKFCNLQEEHAQPPLQLATQTIITNEQQASYPPRVNIATSVMN
eukprot:scaffold82582_cov35-Attheya_sp.AAC.1